MLVVYLVLCTPPNPTGSGLCGTQRSGIKEESEGRGQPRSWVPQWPEPPAHDDSHLKKYVLYRCVFFYILQNTTTAPTLSKAPRPPKPPIRLDQTLTYRLHRLHRASDRDSARAYQEELGLSLSDARCLAAIGSFAPLSVKDLASKANLDKAQASRSAQALVEMKLVEKTSSASDGRGVVLDLTDAGRVPWQRAMDLIGRRNQDIFGTLSPLEQIALADIFDRLLSAYDARDS